MKTWLITGANGHLGGALIRLLETTDCTIRGLVLPAEREKVRDHGNVRYFSGDVTKPDSLTPFFANIPAQETYCVHTAGLINIGEIPMERLRRVNVEGTRNILTLCRQYQLRRMVHVSSVHAIPESAHASVMSEIPCFAPELVNGNYAKTKAEATQLVLDAAKDGQDAVVVLPSGIIGPYDQAGNHLVQMIRDYMLGKLPACVKGGYDMVDVRDVAQGCISAAESGAPGECYILCNRHYDIKEILAMVREKAGGRRLPVLPLWMAKAAAPFFSGFARIRGRRPLYTHYSLAVLGGNDRFSHDKATAELHYRPRDLKQTITDTVAWLKQSDDKRPKPKRIR
ncbi:MAG: NAD-dependent epimerase/dehydratase family protein [Eubacteriales bacterium]|nr:NAD-dependent epimerase/dehydratase family protein [Eubacteriales bacterium]